MPRKAKEITPQPTKRERLTLSQLASYDDILTDALVDHVFFWTTIRKNRSKYNLTRGFSEDDVTDILRKEVVLNHDNTAAEERLLKLPGLRRFIDRLKTKREKDDFKKHLRKYVNMWSNDCPFEVCTTNRYTIVTQEAAVFARQDLKKGENIKYLCGNLVAMTPEEEQDLDLTRRDFSIVMSSRRKTPSLFLGPARFANHDCNANARLVTTGSDGMQVVALRAIESNDEITVTYGEDYFGIDNCECLCKTCEDTQRNGWDPTSILQRESRPSTPVAIGATDEPVEIEAPVSLTRKRKYGESGISRETSVNAMNKLSTRWRRSPSTEDSSVYHENHAEGLGSAVPNNNLPSTMTSTALPAPLNSYDSPQPLQLESEEELKATLRFVASTPSDTGSATPQHAIFKFGSSQSSHESSDAESVFDTVDLVRTTSTPSSTPSSRRFELKAEDIDSLPVAKVKAEADNEDSKRHLEDDVSSLSSLSSSEDFDDARARIVRRPRTRGRTKLAPPAPVSRPRSSQTPSSPHPSSRLRDPQDSATPLVRLPGDYTRTSLLLSEPYSRWVDCRTCDATWVQANGYYTRRECPRCERHSKLYGFRWPKTEPEKKGDTRVLDHRTVHRFLDAEEEKSVIRRGRGLKEGH